MCEVKVADVWVGDATERRKGAKDGEPTLTANGSKPCAAREEEADGLVIYDITGANELFAPQFPSEDALSQRAREMANVLKTSEKVPSAYQHTFEISPGAVRITRTALTPNRKSNNYKPKTVIKEWSAKSRASMVLRLATLDYQAMMNDPAKPPAMITLTYPKYWEQVVPNGEEAKRHLYSLKRRYQKAFGAPMVGLWKMEFQRRGAVHFHLLIVPPNTSYFREWLSINWTEIVAPIEPKDFANHLIAGTGIDYEEGLRAFDPKRVAVYFSKHSSANFGKKEYQNKPPQLWIDAGKVGRFWGYWGISPVVKSVKVEEADAIFIARTLRRWSKAKGSIRRVEVWRVNTDNGKIYKRYCRKRVEYFKWRLGFLTVNDGGEMAHLLSRALERSR